MLHHQMKQLVLYTDLLVKKPSIPSCPSSSQFQSFEKDCEQLLEHAKYAEEYKKPAVFSFFRIKALFHLRSDLMGDELPPKGYWPSPDDLRSDLMGDELPPKGLT